VGATGPTGIHLVTELRKSVATVRVIARSIDKLARLFPEAAVEKLSADILDADATQRGARLPFIIASMLFRKISGRDRRVASLLRHLQIQAESELGPIF
jgi:putative NADH-flavin reductase